MTTLLDWIRSEGFIDHLYDATFVKYFGPTPTQYLYPSSDNVFEYETAETLGYFSNQERGRARGGATQAARTISEGPVTRTIIPDLGIWHTSLTASKASASLRLRRMENALGWNF